MKNRCTSDEAARLSGCCAHWLDCALGYPRHPGHWVGLALGSACGAGGGQPIAVRKGTSAPSAPSASGSISSPRRSISSSSDMALVSSESFVYGGRAAHGAVVGGASVGGASAPTGTPPLHPTRRASERLSHTGERTSKPSNPALSSYRLSLFSLAASYRMDGVGPCSVAWMADACGSDMGSEL